MNLPVSFRRLMIASTLLVVSAAPMAVAQDTPLLVEVAAATNAALTDPIKALGTLKPREAVDITSSVSDKVQTVHVADGATVDAGDLLVSLESAEEKAAVRAAAALVEERRLSYRRAQDLAERKSGPLALAEERRAAYEQAVAGLETAQARLADRQLRAPFAGQLGFKRVSPGALVRPADVIISLWDTQMLYLDFTVSDRHLAALKKGLSVNATATAYPKRVFQGTVDLVNPAVDALTRAVTVRALLDNSDGALKPGMALQVTLNKSPRDALMIPEEALVPSDQGQRVFVIAPTEPGLGTVSQSIVQLGARRPGSVEILSGLVPGQLVVTRGTLRVRPGQTVRFKAEAAQ